MKVTNFEISKKLKEIGFNKSSILGHFSSKCGGGGVFFVNNAIDDGYTLDCYAYDLETLLDVLPNFIENKNGTENCLVLDVAFGEIHYEGDCENDALFITTTKENESLADVAGRLIIKLYEQNLINFHNV